MILEGFRCVGMGPGRLLSLPHSLSLVLAHAGREEDYDFLAGITGCAFGVWASPAEECRAWWTTGGQEAAVEDWTRILGLGYSLEPKLRYPEDFQDLDPKEHEGLVKGPVLQSLERGWAPLAQGMGEGLGLGQWVPVVGWDDEGPLYAPFFSDGCQRSPTPPFRVLSLWPVSEPMGPEEAVREGLRVGLKALTGGLAAGTWVSGPRAWDMLIESAGSEDFCRACGENQGVCLSWLATFLASARASARSFLHICEAILGEKPAFGEGARLLEEEIRLLVKYADAKRAEEALEFGREALVADLERARGLEASLAEVLEGALR